MISNIISIVVIVLTTVIAVGMFRLGLPTRIWAYMIASTACVVALGVFYEQALFAILAAVFTVALFIKHYTNKGLLFASLYSVAIFIIVLALISTAEQLLDYNIMY